MRIAEREEERVLISWFANWSFERRVFKSYELIREERSSHPSSVEGLGGWVESDVTGSIGVGIVENDVEEDGTIKDLAVVKVKEGGGMRRIDGRSR